MERTVNEKLLSSWIKGKESPRLELAFKAGVAYGTVGRLFNGICPGTQKVRVKIASVIGVSEDELFPFCSQEDLAA